MRPRRRRVSPQCRRPCSCSCRRGGTRSVSKTACAYKISVQDGRGHHGVVRVWQLPSISRTHVRASSTRRAWWGCLGGVTVGGAGLSPRLAAPRRPRGAAALPRRDTLVDQLPATMSGSHWRETALPLGGVGANQRPRTGIPVPPAAVGGGGGGGAGPSVAAVRARLKGGGGRGRLKGGGGGVGAPGPLATCGRCWTASRLLTCVAWWGSPAVGGVLTNLPTSRARGFCCCLSPLPPSPPPPSPVLLPPRPRAAVTVRQVKERR